MIFQAIIQPTHFNAGTAAKGNEGSPLLSIVYADSKIGTFWTESKLVFIVYCPLKIPSHQNKLAAYHISIIKFITARVPIMK